MENLETRGRRVFVPGSVGVVSALRQMVTGVVAEKVAMKVSADAGARSSSGTSWR